MIQTKLNTLLLFSLWEMAISQRPVQGVCKFQKLVKNCCISWHVINISDGAATHSKNRSRTGRQQHPCTWTLLKDSPSSAIACVRAHMRVRTSPIQADHWSACAHWQFRHMEQCHCLCACAQARRGFAYTGGPHKRMRKMASFAHVDRFKDSIKKCLAYFLLLFFQTFYSIHKDYSFFLCCL